MSEWLDDPAIVLVGIAFGTLLWKTARWTGRLETVDSDFRAFVKKIDNKIEKLGKKISRIDERIPHPRTLESASPLRLSELGTSISKDMKADEWAARVAQGLAAQVAGKQDFEVDQFSDEYVESRLNNKDAAWVARHAYESGVTPAAVRAVLRVELRDELIRLRTSSRF